MSGKSSLSVAFCATLLMSQTAYADSEAVENLEMEMIAEGDTECACYPFPFEPDPPCFEICAADFMEKTGPEEAVAILNFNEVMQAEILMTPSGSEYSDYVAMSVGNLNDEFREAFEQADQEALQERLEILYSN